MVGIFWAIYFQNILHFSPSKAGLLAFAANLPVLIGAPVAGFLVDRLGPRLPVIIGYACIVFGLSVFLFMKPHEHMSHLLLALLPFGAGAPMTLAPSSVALFSEIPPEKRGSASGLSTGTRQLSATLGIAVFGTVLTMTQNHQLAKFLQTKTATASLDVKQLEGLLSQAPSALNVIEPLSKSNVAFVFTSAKQAFLNGIFAINLVALIVAILGIVVAWVFLSNRPLHSHKK
jgi:MFS family permease